MAEPQLYSQKTEERVNRPEPGTSRHLTRYRMVSGWNQNK